MNIEKQEGTARGREGIWKSRKEEQEIFKAYEEAGEMEGVWESRKEEEEEAGKEYGKAGRKSRRDLRDMEQEKWKKYGKAGGRSGERWKGYREAGEMKGI